MLARMGQVVGGERLPDGLYCFCFDSYQRLCRKR